MFACGRWVSWLAVTCPLWLAACVRVPELELTPRGSLPGETAYPTHLPLFVEVSARGRSGGGCGGGNSLPSDLRLLEATCGEGCTVEDVTEDGTASVRLKITATTPGPKMLDVRVEDHVEGARRVAARYEFFELGEVFVGHAPGSDPGLSAAMLVGFEPDWCVVARAADGRELDLRNSPPELTSMNESFTVEAESTYGLKHCFRLRAAASGTGHLHLSVAGQEQDFHPVVVSEEEIADVHLHEMTHTGDGTLIPLEDEGFIEGPERSHIAASTYDFPIELAVRLVTTDGRMARGGVSRFAIDAYEPRVLWAGGKADASILVLSQPTSPAPLATCLRANLGPESVALPVYIDWTDVGAPDPCRLPEGTGGLGGMGGAGGAGP